MTDAELDEKVRADRRPVEVKMHECIYCDTPLLNQWPAEATGLQWFTVVIACRIRRACATCFNNNEYLQSRWMG